MSHSVPLTATPSCGRAEARACAHAHATRRTTARTPRRTHSSSAAQARKKNGARARPRPAERQKIKRALSLPTPHATAPSASRFGRPRVARPARRRAPPRAGEAPRALARPLLSRDSEGPARESRDTPRAGGLARACRRVPRIESRLSRRVSQAPPRDATYTSSCRARQTFRLVARSRARGVCSSARVLWSSRRTCLPAW